MRFQIDGTTYQITSLEPALDRAFVELHKAAVRGQVVDWAAFEGVAHAFFGTADHRAQDQFFSNFTILWSSAIKSRQWEDAESWWVKSVNIARAWESAHPGSSIHKGTPLYFWGMTVILRGDLDRGYLLMHQALEEDVRATGLELPDTPATALVALNSTKVDQAFRTWVVEQANLISGHLDHYRNSRARQLTLADFDSKFLSAPPDRDVVFIFAHAVARLLRLDEAPELLAGRFAAQLEANLLFDLALVLDAVIHAKNPANWRFIKHAAHLTSAAGLALTETQLGEINGQLQADFDRTLAALVGGTHTLGDGTPVRGLEADIAVSYGIRNYGAHNVTGSVAVAACFQGVRQACFNALFLSLEVLY